MLIAALVVASGLGSGPVPTPALAFHDGAHQVIARRVGDGVELTYPSLGVTVRGLGGERAIVQADDADFARLGIVPVRALLPSRSLWLVESARGEDGVGLASRLSGEPAVREAFPDLAFPLRADSAPDDERYGGQWYLDRIAIEDAWAITGGDPSVKVVVVDNGCDAAHPDLAGKLEPGRDVVDEDDDPSFVPQTAGNEHGTACAGIVAAETGNGQGIAGVCPACRVSCVRMLRHDGLSQPISVSVAAFAFALDAGAAVVSNSWGYVEAIPVPEVLAQAIAEVRSRGRGGLGALVVFASGNDDRRVEEWELLAVDGVIGVGAINTYDEATSFTNYGAPVDLVAPTGTLTTDISGPDGGDPGDYTSSFGGTSSACPVVAGVAGLLASAAPDATGAELESALLGTTRPAPFATPDDAGHDEIYGFGIVDPHAALVRLVGEPAQPPAPAGDDDGGCAAGGSGSSWLALLVLLGLRPRRS